VTVPFLDLKAAVAELRPEIDAAYARVMDSGRYILGPEVEGFEAGFAALCGVGHAVGVGNGLDALAIALEAAGVRPGDEVVVPAHTFIATWLAVTMVGATPVAAEPADGRFNLSAETVEPCLTRRTRAIVPVHLYGEPVEMEPLLALAEARGIAVVEDAAQAHGATRNGRPCGAFGRAAAFSFYPGKNLGAFGDAGAATTDDAEIDAAMRRLRNYGSEARYQHDAAGRNSRLDPLQAAFLSVRLARLEAWNARRREIARFYGEALADVGDLVLPAALPGNLPVWHLYVVCTGRRGALQAALAEAGVETLIHYPKAVYRYPPFAAHGPGNATPADRLTSEILSLPIGPHMTDEQVEQVAAAVKGFFA
jgi:dTDP-3-amino-3,4,6-trideoxy-alpha-D-glucose transaminase